MKPHRGTLILVFGILGSASCLVAWPALAERAPLSPDKLVKESDLVVVGQITDLKIGTERSHIERGFGNYDWAIDLTIQITGVEKGTLASSHAVVARCFRIKSRKSVVEYLTSSGHYYPIPVVGTTIRAHLYQQGGRWRVVFPNGLSPLSDQTTWTDAAAVAGLRSGRYTYLLPAELWALVAVVVAVGTAFLLLAKRIAGFRHRRQANDTPAD